MKRNVQNENSSKKKFKMTRSFALVHGYFPDMENTLFFDHVIDSFAHLTHAFGFSLQFT